MRYAIFSDVHGNRQAWEAVRKDAERQRADTLVCLGDVVGYGPKPLEVLTAIRQVTPNFVLGNHDAAACGRLDPSIFNERARTIIEWTRDQLDEEAIHFLEQVPLQMDAPQILFVHAEVMEPGEFGYIDGPGPAELNLRAMAAPIGFIGHTHLPMAFTMPRKGGQVTQLPPMDFEVERGKRTIVNVGSVGEPRTTDVRASYVIFDEAEQKVYYRKVAFDVDGYKADLLESGLDIQPYFVQVVDAGKDSAGAKAASLSPQIAMSQLPKVAEVVAGNHGHLVLGQPQGQAAWGGAGAGALAGTPGMPFKQPKSMPTWMVIVLIALVVVGLGGVVILASKDKDDETAAAEAAGKKKEKPAAKPLTEAERKALLNERLKEREKERALRASAAADAGPVLNLKARLVARKFENLKQLRAADTKDEGERTRIEEGLPSLEHGKGKTAFGLVWEGYLQAPEAGKYTFTLDSSDGAALILFDETILEINRIGALGKPVKKSYELRKGRNPFRLEYFTQGAAAGLSLTWSGPGLEEAIPLVSAPRAGSDPKVASTPTGDAPKPATPTPKPKPKPKPKPAPKRKPAAKLSQGLVSYWSFDGVMGNERVKEIKPGVVQEKLVAESGQRVRFHVPTADPGATWNDWVKPEFKDAAWKAGPNGVGYEEKPGPFTEALRSKVGGQPRKRPHSVYVRTTFEVPDETAYSDMVLMMRYDDAFVAYLNGKPISRSPNAPAQGVLRWNSSAKGRAPMGASERYERFASRSGLRYLKKGTNLLAIHGLNGGGMPNATNTGCTSADVVLPELFLLRKDGKMPKESPGRYKGDLVVKKEDLNGTVTPSEGKFGDAYAFADGSIEVGSQNDYAIGEDSFTVSAWFTRSAKGVDKDARRLLSAGAGSERDAGWALYLSGDATTLVFEMSDGAKVHRVEAKQGSFANDQWFHAVATFERTSQEVQLFVNGKLVKTAKVAIAPDTVVESASGLALGRNSADAQHHRGKLDDIALWRRALVPEEVQKIHKTGKGLGTVFGVE